MKIVLAKHAKDQLNERQIKRQDVIRVIKFPDKISQQSLRRYLAIKKFTSGQKLYLLVVVFERKDATITVVTTFITSKLKKYL